MKKEKEPSKRKTDEEIEEALRDSNGFISTAAKKLNINEKTIRNRIKKSATLQTIQQELKTERDDLCENMLMKGIMEGNTALIIFYAKTQMQGRGYSERPAAGENGDGGLTIKHTFEFPNGETKTKKIDFKL